MLQGVVAVAASSSLNRASGSHTPQFMVVSQQQRDRRDPATEVLRAVGAGWQPLPQWSELRMPISRPSNIGVPFSAPRISPVAQWPRCSDFK